MSKTTQEEALEFIDGYIENVDAHLSSREESLMIYAYKFADSKAQKELEELRWCRDEVIKHVVPGEFDSADAARIFVQKARDREKVLVEALEKIIFVHSSECIVSDEVPPPFYIAKEALEKFRSMK